MCVLSEMTMRVADAADDDDADDGNATLKPTNGPATLT